MTANGLPSGLSINATTGLITGSSTALGVYNVTITVTGTHSVDGTFTRSATFVWTIANTAPVGTANSAQRTTGRDHQLQPVGHRCRR